MDTSIDRIAFIVDEMEEDPNHDSMTDIIDSIDEKFLIAKEAFYLFSLLLFLFQGNRLFSHNLLKPPF